MKAGFPGPLAVIALYQGLTLPPDKCAPPADQGAIKRRLFITNTPLFFSHCPAPGGGFGGIAPPGGGPGDLPPLHRTEPGTHSHPCEPFPPQGEATLPYLIIYRNNYGDLQNPLPFRGGVQITNGGKAQQGRKNSYTVEDRFMVYYGDSCVEKSPMSC